MKVLKIRLLLPLRLKTHSTNAPIVTIISIVLMMLPITLKMNMKTTRQVRILYHFVSFCVILCHLVSLCVILCHFILNSNPNF